jgi:hypothetical protein
MEWIVFRQRAIHSLGQLRKVPRKIFEPVASNLKPQKPPSRAASLTPHDRDTFYTFNSLAYNDYPFANKSVSH